VLAFTSCPDALTADADLVVRYPIDMGQHRHAHTHRHADAHTNTNTNTHTSSHPIRSSRSCLCLVHCGDFSDSGSEEEVRRFNRWLGSLPHAHKVVISGNMDGLGLDARLSSVERAAHLRSLFTNAVYLQHESVLIEGMRVFGSPYTPEFVGGFQLHDEREATRLWRTIPDDVDVLITHGRCLTSSTTLCMCR
jgi:predicted phosphodiesterase